jgi:hypothetical protein
VNTATLPDEIHALVRYSYSEGDQGQVVAAALRADDLRACQAEDNGWASEQWFEEVEVLRPSPRLLALYSEGLEFSAPRFAEFTKREIDYVTALAMTR